MKNNKNSPVAGIFIFSKEIKNDGSITAKGEKANIHIETNNYAGKGSILATSSSLFEKRIKRGKESWEFIYLVFGILLSICTFIISIVPLGWEYKIISFVFSLGILTWLCLFNAWFQNKIIGIKINIESTWRKI